MRKIIVSMNMTLDGFMAGPGQELDWHFGSWNGEMAAYLCDQLNQADTILLGRVTYSAMARYWPAVSSDPGLPEQHMALAKMMNNYHKVVVSRTLNTLQWNHSTCINGSMKREIAKLKQASGRDIIVYGSGMLVSSLIRWNFIDQYILWIHPIILARGRPLFGKAKDKHALMLRKTITFSSGVVLLDYDAAGNRF